MNRCVRLVLLLALLPLAGIAQQYKEPLSVYKARLDSIQDAAANVSSDEDEDDEYQDSVVAVVDTASVYDNTVDTASAPVVLHHQLWDKEIPVDKDSIDY